MHHPPFHEPLHLPSPRVPLHSTVTLNGAQEPALFNVVAEELKTRGTAAVSIRADDSDGSLFESTTAHMGAAGLPDVPGPEMRQVARLPFLGCTPLSSPATCLMWNPAACRLGSSPPRRNPLPPAAPLLNRMCAHPALFRGRAAKAR